MHRYFKNKNKIGKEIETECRAELIEHRKMLMSDYQLNPNVVKFCANEIKTYCQSLERNGKTLHCLLNKMITLKTKESNKDTFNAKCFQEVIYIAHTIYLFIYFQSKNLYYLNMSARIASSACQSSGCCRRCKSGRAVDGRLSKSDHGSVQKHTIRTGSSGKLSDKIYWYATNQWRLRRASSRNSIFCRQRLDVRFSNPYYN